jgi:hypothetical protein
MQRLVLCHELQKKLDEIQDGNALGTNSLGFDFGDGSGPARTTGMTANRSNSLATTSNRSSSQVMIPNRTNGVLFQTLLSKHLDFKELRTASYLCDFGNVIVGMKRKRVFKIFNATASESITWVFNKKILSNTGFSIDPEKVEKLTGLTSVDVTVLFQARGGLGQKLGRKNLVLPVEMKGGGPSIQLILSANVCLPEIEISSDSLDFDRVMLGRSKQSFVRLWNTSPVTASWNFKLPAGKNDDKFMITPTSGSLRSGAKEVVLVEFIPTECRKYGLEVVLRTDAKSSKLHLVGEGLGATLKFEPGMVDLGTVLPLSPGVERVITLTNQGNSAIEVFSLDFDKTFTQEEEMLNNIQIYDADNMYRTSVRNAGEQLPAIIESTYLKVLALREKEKLKEGVEEEDISLEFLSPPIRFTHGPR